MDTATGLKNFDSFPNEVKSQVMRGEQPCPLCNNDPWQVWNCACRALKEFWRIFTDNVPEHDLFVNLKTLQPNSKNRLPLERQQEVLDAVRSHPLGSYAFFGPAGTGKTTVSVGLYRRALGFALKAFWQKRPHDNPTNHAWNNFGLWRVSAKTLLEDFHRESMHDKDLRTGKEIHPVVDRAKIKHIKRMGLTPRLFIEEIDKVRYTEFKMNALWEIFDAAYENNVQLVFNTNLMPGEFFSQFESIGPSKEISSTFFRRVEETSTIFNFFAEQQR
jgi:hypothetical protein